MMKHVAAFECRYQLRSALFGIGSAIFFLLPFGSITVDQTVLGSKGRTRDFVIGTPSAGPVSDTWDDPRWTAFVEAYKKQFPDGFPSPSLFAHAYYVNTKAALLALEEVNGDLSDGGKAFREALTTLEFETPKLDPRHLRLCPSKTVLFGCIDNTIDEIETPEHVAAQLLRAAEYLPPEQLQAAPDCGLIPLHPSVARAKLTTLAAGARLARERIKA